MRISDWSSDVCSSDLVARGAVAARQFGGDVVPRQATLGKQDGEVEDEVGGLAGQRGIVLGERRDDGLDRFLAELLRDLAAALGGEARDLRSEERRVGKECGSSGSSRWSPDH